MSVLLAQSRPATSRDPSGLGIERIDPKAEQDGAGMPYLPCPKQAGPVFLCFCIRLDQH